MFPRVAGVCGLLALVTSTVGWVAGGLAQPASYSPANDDISDLGAVTANSAWLCNQIGANLTGLLVVVLAIGVWQALSPDLLGRLGAAALLVVGAGGFLDGLFRLDCRGIDAAWGVTAAREAGEWVLIDPQELQRLEQTYQPFPPLQAEWTSRPEWAAGHPFLLPPVQSSGRTMPSPSAAVK